MQNTLKRNMTYLESFDPEVAGWMEQEYRRQCINIELIASENIASPAVITAMGSVLTNKYAGRLSRPPVLRRMPVRG